MEQTFISEALKLEFDLVTSKITFTPHPEGDLIAMASVQDTLGRHYFLKEIQQHSLHKGLDSNFELLSNCRFEKLRLVLPVRARHGRFVFLIQGTAFLLFAFETLIPLDLATYSHTELLNVISELHESWTGFQLKGQPMKSYRAWLERGLHRTEALWGEGLPLIERGKEFLSSRFEELSKPKANIHADLHKNNFFMNSTGHLTLIDFDSVKYDSILWDFTRVTAMFSRFSENKIFLNSNSVNELQTFLAAKGLAVQKADLRFLIARVHLGSLFTQSSVLTPIEITAILKNFELFVTTEN